MKMRRGWRITTSHNDHLVISDSDFGTIRWAKLHNYKFSRILVLK